MLHLPSTETMLQNNLYTDQDIARHMAAILQLLDDKQAIDVVTADMRSRSSVADYFIVCSGNSRTHTQSLAQILNGYAKEHELTVYGLEGQSEGLWVLFDLGFVIVHIMQESQRLFYNLEQLWNHGKQDKA